MKLKIIFAVLTGLATTACTPSAADMKALMQKHPEILQAAIEADPKGFFDTIQKVQAKAHESSLAEQMESELKRVQNDMKTPKAVEVNADRAIQGPDSAPITIVEYADFNCGHCAHAKETIEKIKSEYPGKIRVLFKHLPILAKESRTAAEYMEAISLQDKDKAWKFHNELYDKQEEFQKDGEAFLKKATKDVGANLAKVEKDIKGDVVKGRIAADEAEAKKYEFTGTPGFMINGAEVHGAYPYEFFKKVVDAVLSAPAAKG